MGPDPGGGAALLSVARDAVSGDGASKDAVASAGAATADGKGRLGSGVAAAAQGLPLGCLRQPPSSGVHLPAGDSAAHPGEPLCGAGAPSGPAAQRAAGGAARFLSAPPAAKGRGAESRRAAGAAP
ncbi:hypothetical protein D3C75_566710 [compost metagenome]